MALTTVRAPTDFLHAPTGCCLALYPLLSALIHCCLLRSSEPTQDERKLMGMKWTACLMVGAVLTGYYKRFRWGPLKSRRISYV